MTWNPERVGSLVSEHPVILFGKGSREQPACGFTARALGVLEACGRPFEVVNIFDHPDIRPSLVSYSGWSTSSDAMYWNSLFTCCLRKVFLRSSDTFSLVMNCEMNSLSCWRKFLAMAMPASCVSGSLCLTRSLKCAFARGPCDSASFHIMRRWSRVASSPAGGMSVNCVPSRIFSRGSAKARFGERTYPARLRRRSVRYAWRISLVDAATHSAHHGGASPT